jgi:REP element-mobilizing transposase RayT
MKFDPYLHHRSTQRLKGYDYSSEGCYFVTICVHDRRCLFGNIEGQKMFLNDAGNMVDYWCSETMNKYPNVNLSKFVVMPNHIHALFELSSVVGADRCIRPSHNLNRPGGIPQIVQWFKIMTTNEYIRGVKTLGWESFDGHLWQRNFYDHILDERDDYDGVVYYIDQNPADWANDPLCL